MGEHEYDGLVNRTSQVNGLCLVAEGRAFDVALMRMSILLLLDGEETEPDPPIDEDDDEEKEKEDEKDKPDDPVEELIDGMPEEFIGPLLENLVSHEVGHTLGLRHNFKGSSAYKLQEINSDGFKGQKPNSSSVMDDLTVNIRMETGEIQGDYIMKGIGPYDEWAIQYGYSSESDLDPILDRVSEAGLQYATDEDVYGPDPFARRYDFSLDSLDYAQEQIRLASHHRNNLLEKFVEDKQSWSRARKGCLMTLALQTRAVSMMANWIGGVHFYRDKKGDSGGRTSLQVVDAAKQRAALKFVIDNSFNDEIWGLTPELLNHMTPDKWLDEDFFRAFFSDPTWPVHDRILGIQASTLTMLMNPSTLQLIYDNEFRMPADQDALTLAELLEAISGSIWSELNDSSTEMYTNRQPMISSLRQNLQREHADRLITLILPGTGYSAAYKPISYLAVRGLKKIQEQAEAATKGNGKRMDTYSAAHLENVLDKIKRALEAGLIYNTRDLHSSGRRL
jgi:hypothetical protein